MIQESMVIFTLILCYRLISRVAETFSLNQILQVLLSKPCEHWLTNFRTDIFGTVTVGGAFALAFCGELAPILTASIVAR